MCSIFKYWRLTSQAFCGQMQVQIVVQIQKKLQTPTIFVSIQTLLSFHKSGILWIDANTNICTKTSKYLYKYKNIVVQIQILVSYQSGILWASSPSLSDRPLSTGVRSLNLNWQTWIKSRSQKSGILLFSYLALMILSKNGVIGFYLASSNIFLSFFIPSGLTVL